MSLYFRLRRKDVSNVAILLKQSFPELKNCYTEDIEEVLRKTGISFYYKENKKVKVYMRLTLPFALVAMIILAILSPINFIINGRWGYKITWVRNWFISLGF